MSFGNDILNEDTFIEIYKWSIKLSTHPKRKMITLLQLDKYNHHLILNTNELWETLTNCFISIDHHRFLNSDVSNLDHLFDFNVCRGYYVYYTFAMKKVLILNAGMVGECENIYSSLKELVFGQVDLVVFNHKMDEGERGEIVKGICFGDYAVVVLYGYYSFPSGVRVELEDKLCDFIEDGGKVITGAFTNSNCMLGNLQKSFDPVTPGTCKNIPSIQKIDVSTIVPHPLFDYLDIEVLEEFVGPDQNHINSNEEKFKGNVLVRWEPGDTFRSYPFIIEAPNPRIIGINCFLATSIDIERFGCLKNIPEIVASIINYLRNTPFTAPTKIAIAYDEQI